MSYQKKKNSNNRRDKRDARRDVETSERSEDTRDSKNRSTRRKPVFTTREKQNNPEWWMRYPQMAKDAGNISYSWPTGPNFSNNPGGTVPFNMVLYSQIAPGISKDQNSPVNVAARRYYSTIRQANSGAKNYDSQDVIMYFLAMDSIYAYISMLMRIYGIINVYSAENRTVPKFLLEGMGIAYDDVVQHIPDLRTYINTLIYKAASFAVPQDMGIFERHIQMFGNIYLDWANARGQTYVYVPETLFKFDEVNGKLESTVWATSVPLPNMLHAAAFQDLVDFGDTLINAIYGYETASLMSGDILKAYGDKIIKLAPMDWDYRVEPVYSEETLLQIHNTVVAGIPVSDTDIVQDASGTFLIYDPHFELPQDISAYAGFSLDNFRTMVQGDAILDVPLTDISTDMNFVASCDLCTFDWTHVNDAQPYYELASCRTEFITRLAAQYFPIGGNFWVQGEFQSGLQPLNYSAYTNLAGQFNKSVLLTKFDWAPRMRFMFINTAGTTWTGGEAMWDITKYALVSDDIISKIHEVALLSAFVSPASTYLV